MFHVSVGLIYRGKLEKDYCCPEAPHGITLRDSSEGKFNEQSFSHLLYVEREAA